MSKRRERAPSADNLYDLRSELNDLKAMIATLDRPKHQSKRGQRTNKTVVQIVNPQSEKKAEAPQKEDEKKKEGTEDYLKYFKF